LFQDASAGPVLEFGDSPVAGDPMGTKKVRLYQTLYERLLTQLHAGG